MQNFVNDSCACSAEIQISEIADSVSLSMGTDVCWIPVLTVKH